MTVFDEAEAIKTMIEVCGIKRSEISKMLGISESALSNKLRLLRLSSEVRSEVVSSGLSERHARLLLKLSDTENRLNFIKEIKARSLTVAEAEAYLEMHFLENTYISKNTFSPAEAKERFIDNINKGTKALTSLGIKSDSKVTHYGKKSYITIVIE